MDENATSLKIAILDYEPPVPVRWEIMTQIQDQLSQYGHVAFFAKSSLTEMEMDVEQIAGLVEQVEADAWIVTCASRSVLEWFEARGQPALALFGRRRGLEMSSVGPNLMPVLQQALRRMIELGHQKIVWMDRSARFEGSIGDPEKVFIRELKKHGIPTGPQNMANWSGGVEAFHQRLDELFADADPPTALIFNEPCVYVGAMSFLMNRGLKIPEDVSMMSTNHDRNLMWCSPAVAHIRWSQKALVRQVVKWANRVADGDATWRHVDVETEYVDGGSLGPVKK